MKNRIFYSILQLALLVGSSLSLSLQLPDANPSLYIYDSLLGVTKNRRRSKFNKSFSGKRIWIVGASSGIGAELAKELHDHGAKLVLSARREKELTLVRDQCLRDIASSVHADASIHGTNDGDSIQILPLDVTTDDTTLSKTVQTAISYYQGIDILILNAGRGQLSPALMEEGSATTRNLMEINFMGPVRVAMELIKLDCWGQYRTDTDNKVPSQKRGHIVVTSSVVAKMAVPLSSSYAASKHAVQGYFSSLRSENPWLRVDLPCPGPIATDFQNRVYSTAPPTSNSDVKVSTCTKEDNNNSDEDTSEVKMPVGRCVQLILSSMAGPAYLMHETWISRQPTLGYMFLNQYFPTLSTGLIGIMGPLRAKAWEMGLPLYKASSWIQAAKAERQRRADIVKENEKKAPFSSSESEISTSKVDDASEI